MTTTLTHIEASRNLLRTADENRLVQGSWYAERDGKHLACMLYAMGNGLAIDSVEKCPSGVMPPWLAPLVVGLFDGMRDTDAFAWARRFGEQMAHPNWLAVTGDILRVEFLIGTVEEALGYARPRCEKEAYWSQVESAARQVQVALRGDGDLSAARSAALGAAWGAAWGAESAAESAARSAARSAAESAESAAWSAARSAARSAAESAESAAWSAAWSAAESAARSAAESAESAAWSAAWSAQASRLCDLIDAALTAQEGSK